MKKEKLNLEKALEINEVDKAKIKKIHEHPKGWEPSIEWNGSTGHIVALIPDDRELYSSLWDELIKDWGLDPDLVAIDQSTIQIRGWDANVSEGTGKEKVTYVRRMKYYKANIVLRQTSKFEIEWQDVISEIKKSKAKKILENNNLYDLVVCVSDWQIGKGEGDGSNGSVNRIMNSLSNLTQHIKDLKKLNRNPNTIYLVGMGDLVEQCSGHYAMQAFQVDLDRREQMRVVRRLLLEYVNELYSLCSKLVLVAVPGNHGENRLNGKAFTNFTDNDDLAVFEQISEMLSTNPEKYSNVHVLLSKNLSATFSACEEESKKGIIIGITHMHAGRSGKDPRAKVMNWWKGHALGRGDVHDADILVTGHYHHLMIDESSGRTWFQCPAQDPGSAWFEEMTGQHSPDGLLVFSVSHQFGERKWGDLKIL
jgi:hypothetical protein